MPVLGTLALSVTANTAQLTTGLAKASNVIVNFAGNVGNMMGSVLGKLGGGAFEGGFNLLADGISGVGKALGAIPFVGGIFDALGSGVSQGTRFMAGFAQEQANLIDNFAKLSDRLGITTEDFFGLVYAGDLAGVSSEALTGGLEKYLKTLSELQTGNNELGQSLIDLGLDMRAVEGLSVGDGLGILFDQINALPSAVNRAGAAMALFGKSGQGLVPLIQSGSQGLREMTQESKDLGLAVSRIDAAKVEAVNDAFTRLTGAVKGFVLKAVVLVSPYIEAAVTSVTNFIKSFGGLGGIAQGAFGLVKDGILLAATAADGFITYLRMGAVDVIEMGSQMVSALKEIGTQLESLAGQASKLEGVFSRLSPIGIVQDGVTEIGKWWRGVEEQAKKSGKTAGEHLAEGLGKLSGVDVRGKVEGAMKGIEERAEAMARNVVSAVEKNRGKSLFDFGGQAETKNITKQLEKDVKPKIHMDVAADVKTTILRGSQEEASFLAQLQRQIVAAREKSDKDPEAKKQTELQQKMADGIDGMTKVLDDIRTQWAEMGIVARF